MNPQQIADAFQAEVVVTKHWGNRVTTGIFAFEESFFPAFEEDRTLGDTPIRMRD